MGTPIHWIAILVAAASGFVIGGLWYGPLFGKPWQAARGLSDAALKSGNMPMIFGLTFLLNLVAAFFLDHTLATYPGLDFATKVMIRLGRSARLHHSGDRGELSLLAPAAQAVPDRRRLLAGDLHGDGRGVCADRDVRGLVCSREGGNPDWTLSFAGYKGQMFELIPHPDTPPALIRAVQIELTGDADEIRLTARVDGSENLVIPNWESPARADNLWTTTCFEMFLNPAETQQYYEFNFSPSCQWAAYKFEGYRDGMRELDLPVCPLIERGFGSQRDYVIEVDLDLASIPSGPMKIGLSAVIEELDGTKSYWALAHAPGKPDFHNSDCFIATLPGYAPVVTFDLDGGPAKLRY